MIRPQSGPLKKIEKNENWVLTIPALPAILITVPSAKPKRNKRFGGIAQLGERMTGSHEVSGSIPLISTKKETC